MCLILSVYEVVIQWPSMFQTAGLTSAIFSSHCYFVFLINLEANCGSECCDIQNGEGKLTSFSADVL